MSVRVSAWAWQAQVPPPQKIVLLALADHADEDGICWPGYAHVATKTGYSGRHVRTLLDKLEAASLVRRELLADDSGRTLGLRFHLLAERAESSEPASNGGGTGGPGGWIPSSRGGGSPDPPNRQEEPLRSSSLRSEERDARAQADECLHDDAVSSSSKRRHSYNGRRVPPSVVADADLLLAAFCAATERRIGSRTHDGRLSPATRQIVGALLERPDVPVERWADAISRIAVHPPSFAEGQPLQLGHVFGAKAAEWALDERAAATPARRDDGRRMAYEQRVEQDMAAIERLTGRDMRSWG